MALRTVCVVLAFFAMVYVVLVFTNRLGKIAYLIAGLSLVFGGIYLLLSAGRFKSDPYKSNILAVLASISLWGFVGEFLENADLYVNHASIEIARWNHLPVLLISIFTFFYLLKSKFLPVFLLFFLGSFLGIWVLHYVMILEIEVLSSTSPITYSTFGIFLAGSIFCGQKMMRSDRVNESMAYALGTLYLGWSLLEFMWIWRLIPGPYSM